MAQIKTQEQTIVHHLANAPLRSPQHVAVRYPSQKIWLELSWREYYQRCEAAGLALLGMGIKKGDRIAILAKTRWEWAALDFGILGIGAVTVPIYPSHRPDEIEFILQHSEARVLVVDDRAQLSKWEPIAKRCKLIEQVICLDPTDDLPDNVQSWDEFLDHGTVRARQSPQEFAKLCRARKIDDLASIVYTSGTTGAPKGVLITHQQVMSEVEDLTRAFPISALDSTLCFLPFAHVLGRVELWLHMYVGFTMNYAQSIERLRPDLVKARPSAMIGVPRIFEKIHAGLMTQVQSKPWQKRMFNRLDGAKSWIEKTLADKLIYRKIRQGLGGNLRFVVSGGAPLEAELAQFFYKAGVLILEGYGLTETTAAVLVNTPSSFQFGTVGRPLTDVEVKLADDGEILVKSKKVMRGYHKDDEATQAAFQNGYFCTGDIGEWTEDGFLRITDRKKDLIKTAGGKYVAPQKLEGLLKLCPLISHVLIHGDRKKYVVALITLNEAFAKQLAKQNKWAYKNYHDLTQSREIREVVRQAIAETNAKLASFETIKNFAILPEDFSLERNELTPSLKVKRRICDERYKTEIEELY